MKDLDPENRLLEGASSHKYYIGDVVRDKFILEYERRNGFELPLSYQTYLRYFGGCGASDFNGTHDFLTKIRSTDISQPSLLEKFEGVVELQDRSGFHPIKSSDGIVEIAKGFNPSVPFLVLNGVASGWVYWWNYDDMVGGLGQFDEWYRRWTDNALLILRKHEKMRSIPVGASIVELEETFPGEVTIEMKNNIEYARVEGLSYSFRLDENRVLAQLLS